MTFNWAISPHDLLIVMSFGVFALVLVLTVIVIALLSKQRIKAAGWFRNVGFSLEASNDDDNRPGNEPLL